MAEKEKKTTSDVREELKKDKEIESKLKDAIKKEKKLELIEKKKIHDYERNIMRGEGPYQHIKKEKMLGGKGWVKFHPSKAKMRKKIEEEKE